MKRRNSQVLKTRRTTSRRPTCYTSSDDDSYECSPVLSQLDVDSEDKFEKALRKESTRANLQLITVPQKLINTLKKSNLIQIKPFWSSLAPAYVNEIIFWYSLNTLEEVSRFNLESLEMLELFGFSRKGFDLFSAKMFLLSVYKEVSEYEDTALNFEEVKNVVKLAFEERGEIEGDRADAKEEKMAVEKNRQEINNRLTKENGKEVNVENSKTERNSSNLVGSEKNAISTEVNKEKNTKKKKNEVIERTDNGIGKSKVNIEEDKKKEVIEDTDKMLIDKNKGENKVNSESEVSMKEDTGKGEMKSDKNILEKKNTLPPENPQKLERSEKKEQKSKEETITTASTTSGSTTSATTTSATTTSATTTSATTTSATTTSATTSATNTSATNTTATTTSTTAAFEKKPLQANKLKMEDEESFEEIISDSDEDSEQLLEITTTKQQKSIPQSQDKKPLTNAEKSEQVIKSFPSQPITIDRGGVSKQMDPTPTLSKLHNFFPVSKQVNKSNQPVVAQFSFTTSTSNKRGTNGNNNNNNNKTNRTSKIQPFDIMTNKFSTFPGQSSLKVYNLTSNLSTTPAPQVNTKNTGETGTAQPQFIKFKQFERSYQEQERLKQEQKQQERKKIREEHEKLALAQMKNFSTIVRNDLDDGFKQSVYLNPQEKMEQQLRRAQYPWNIKDWKKSNEFSISSFEKYFIQKEKKRKQQQKREQEKLNEQRKQLRTGSTIESAKREEIEISSDDSSSSSKKKKTKLESKSSSSSSSSTDEGIDVKKIPGVKTKLFAHQRVGVEWLLKREREPYNNVRGGMLCDEMGLGKTLSLLCLVAFDLNRNKGPTIVVSSKTLLNVWKAEIQRHFKRGSIKVLILLKNIESLTLNDLKRVDVILTTYDTVKAPVRYFEKMEEDRLQRIFEKYVDKRDQQYELNKVKSKIRNSPFTFQNLKEMDTNRPQDLIYKMKFRRIICDEGHEFRNPKTQVARAVQSISAERRWYSSGTPIQNNSIDLYSALKYLNFKHPAFKSVKAWNKLVKEAQNRYPSRFKIEGDTLDPLTAECIPEWMATLVLRRTKQEIGQVFDENNEKASSESSEGEAEDQPVKLKPLNNIILKSKFSTLEEECLYKTYQKEAVDQFQGWEQNSVTYVNILASLTRLRQACVSPTLLPGTRSSILNKVFAYCTPSISSEDSDSDTDKPKKPSIIVASAVRSLKELCARHFISKFKKLKTNDKEILTYFETAKLNFPEIYSTKIKMILEYLKKTPPEDKVLIFSEWTSCFDVLGKVLHYEGIDWVQVDGTQQVSARESNILEFETKKQKKVLLLSLKVGSNGLNLVAANHVIFIEPWWNPFVHQQAQSRVYRTGQLKEVFSVFLLIENSVEERVLEISEKKKGVASSLLTQKEKTGLSKDEVRKLLACDGDDDEMVSLL